MPKSVDVAWLVVTDDVAWLVVTDRLALSNRRSEFGWRVKERSGLEPAAIEWGPIEVKWASQTARRFCRSSDRRSVDQGLAFRRAWSVAASQPCTSTSVPTVTCRTGRSTGCSSKPCRTFWTVRRSVGLSLHRRVSDSSGRACGVVTLPRGGLRVRDGLHGSASRIIP